MRFNIEQTQSVLTESTKNKGRRYKCPYCEKKDYKVELVNHIDKEHKDMIPEGYTSARIVFNMINKKDHGTCVCGCGKETAWREDLWRYDRYSTLQCKEKYSKEMKQRMINKYGKEHLLNDTDMQEKMLSGRSISGTYKFSKGGEVSYVGTYEKKLLEFFDKVMGYKAIDIDSPGPIIEYEYEGKYHKWITDQYLIPYNLVFDVKDGGDNPNTRDMKDYRAKQIAKEKAIIKQGKYNYIRLTNNNFAQLLLILAEIKEAMMNTEDGTIKPIIKINESSDEEKKDDKYSSWDKDKIEMTLKKKKKVYDYEKTIRYSVDRDKKNKELEELKKEIEELEKALKKDKNDKEDDDEDDEEILDEYNSAVAGAIVGITNNPNSYIVPYLQKNSFTPEYGITNDENMDYTVITDDNGNMKLKGKEFFQHECSSYSLFKYNKPMFSNPITWETTNLFEIATGKRLLHPEQIYYDSDFTKVMTEMERNIMIAECFEATMTTPKYKYPVINEEYLDNDFIMFYEDENGFFAENYLSMLRCKSVTKLEILNENKELINYILKGKLLG